MESKQKKPAARRLVKLFFSMLYISAFTFGGGFVIVTLMKRKFVDELHWIDGRRNAGYRGHGAVLAGRNRRERRQSWWAGAWAGFAGMLTSVIATIIPPMAILTVISHLLCGLCQQSVCFAGAARHAGRRSGGYSGCGVRPWHQGVSQPFRRCVCASWAQPLSRPLCWM